MPYQSNNELPKGVKVLPAHAQSMFRAAFNNAWETTCKDRADREECCMKIAWGAVKTKYHMVNGMWVEK